MGLSSLSIKKNDFGKLQRNLFSSKLSSQLFDINPKIVHGILLIAIAGIALFSRLFSVLRFESIIHEFDPWFNFRATEYLVANGWYAFLNWFDETAWYPLGRVVGGTVYPGIMVTAAIIHSVLGKIAGVLGADPIAIKDVCVFLAPVFSGLTALAAYLVTCELKDSAAGLLAAAFIAICPGYISRSVAGSYDNEGIAIFLMIAIFGLWLRALRTGSAFTSVLAALTYYWLVAAWGGYVFVANLIPLHALTLLVMGRFSARLYTAYSSWYVIGTLAAMTVPFVGFQPVSTSEHMASLGVFGLVQIVAISSALRSYLKESKHLVKFGLGAMCIVGSAAFVVLTVTGKIAPWTGRFYSLWDTDYACKYIPIIASVSEHQPTTWASFFFDLHFLLAIFPAGLIWALRRGRDEHIFVVVYAVTATYFAGVMIRLILTLAPIMCIGAALALSGLFDGVTNNPQGHQLQIYDDNLEDDAIDSQETNKKNHMSWDAQIMVGITIAVILAQFVWHCTWVTSTAYSSPSVILQTQGQDGRARIIDDFREAYHWLRMNTASDAKILAWWDYGYQLAGMADRTTIADNNTWNNTHIATIGKIFASNEVNAYPVMRQLGVDYVLVLFGGVSGFSGDDINKFLWMIRIAEGVFPNEVREADFLTANQEYRVDSQASEAMRSSLLYKMSYTGIVDMMGPRAMDRVRYSPLYGLNPKLASLTEVYSTEHWIVRIFQLRKPDPLGRSHQQVAKFNGVI